MQLKLTGAELHATQKQPALWGLTPRWQQDAKKYNRAKNLLAMQIEIREARQVPLLFMYCNLHRPSATLCRSFEVAAWQRVPGRCPD